MTPRDARAAPTACPETAMHLQNRNKAASTGSRSAPSALGTVLHAALWIAVAVGLALSLNATGVRFPIAADVPAMTPSD